MELLNFTDRAWSAIHGLTKAISGLAGARPKMVTIKGVGTIDSREIAAVLDGGIIVLKGGHVIENVVCEDAIAAWREAVEG